MPTSTVFWRFITRTATALATTTTTTTTTHRFVSHPHSVIFLLLICFTIMVHTTDSLPVSKSGTAIPGTSRHSSSSSSLLSQTKGWIVVDFDGTCSVRDTTPLLPKLAALHDNDNNDVGDPSCEATVVTKQERLQTFAQLEQERILCFVQDGTRYLVSRNHVSRTSTRSFRSSL